MIWDPFSVAVIRAVQRHEIKSTKGLVYAALDLLGEVRDTLSVAHLIVVVDNLIALRHLDKDPVTGVYVTTSKIQDFEKTFKVYAKLAFNN